MSTLAFAREQIVFARGYTNRLLDATPAADWLRVPPGGVSHIAWQVGHLAMAQYRLALERLRGRRPEDEALISDAFVARFGPKSFPEADLKDHPTADEVRAVFNRVHARVLDELQGVQEGELDQPVLRPHRVCTTKRGSLFWCAQHEMLHAGQVGLLRRQLGHAPLW